MINQEKMDRVFYKWMYDTYGDLHLTISQDFIMGPYASLQI